MAGNHPAANDVPWVDVNDMNGGEILPTDTLRVLDASNNFDNRTLGSVLRTKLTKTAHALVAGDVGKPLEMANNGDITVWDDAGTKFPFAILKRRIDNDNLEFAAAGDVITIADALLPTDIETEVSTNGERVLFWDASAVKYVYELPADSVVQTDCIIALAASGVDWLCQVRIPQRALGSSSSSELPSPANLPWVDVKEDYGAVGDDVTDDSAAFTNAIAAGTTIVVPAGTYRVKDLVPLDDMRIIASDGAVIKGLTTADNIFTTSSAKLRVHISGGRWSHCDHVWKHTGINAVNTCVFEKMYFRNLTTSAFAMSTSVGNTWRECNFGGAGAIDPNENPNYLDFDLTGDGATNQNLITNCRFDACSGTAIKIGDGATSDQNCSRNSIVHNWFERLDEGAIKVDTNTGTVYHLIIDSNYFENTGDATNPTIRLNGNIRSARVTRNIFLGPPTGQLYHVHNSGLSWAYVNENYFDCNTAGQDMVAFNASGSGASNAVSSFINNYVISSSPTTRTLKETSITGTQPVEYRTHVGGFTQDDDEYPQRHRIETISDNVVDVADATGTSFTLDALKGTVFFVTGVSGSDLTDIVNARKGQKFEVHLRDANVSVTGGSGFDLSTAGNITAPGTNTVLHFRSIDDSSNVIETARATH